jgi:hypothetical protein
MPAALAALRHRPRALRLGLLAAAAAAVVVTVLGLRPIVQAADHYAFADARTVLGVPHGWNVLSNLPFALVGMLGLVRAEGLAPGSCLAARVVFVAIAAAALGSSVYHLAPSPDRLLLDRVPITLAFAGLFAWTLGDRLGPRLAPWTLGPLCALALAALLAWYRGGAGDGDLRPYVLVQALPLACIPLLLALFPGTLDGRRVALALLLYLAAKACELLDFELYAASGFVSGHALKHLLAAAACACFVPGPRVLRV